MFKKSKNINNTTEELAAIIKNFTREIIRYKPKDIIDFAAQYFYCLENDIALKYPNLQVQNSFSLETEFTAREEHKKNSQKVSSIKNEIPNKRYNLNDNEDKIEENDSNNYDIRVPISMEMEEIIKNQEINKLKVSQMKKIKENGISENEPIKKEVENFISGLFLDL